MNEVLRSHKCLPCEGGVKPLSPKEIKGYLASLSGRWRYVAKEKAIRADYKAGDFAAAVKMIQKIARVAERENHHPDVHLTKYRYLSLALSTHAIGGLSVNDFILASKINVVLR